MDNNIIDKRKEALIKILDAIAEDAKNDAAEMDGKPFTGKTVATYFGYHGAAISSLANILKEILTQKASETI